MQESPKDISNHGGIYIILNIVDDKVKAYVGQASKFSKRDHNSDLHGGVDNSKLQKDFDNIESGKEFIYFVVKDMGCNSHKKKRNYYEKLYINLLNDKDFGFELYNEIIPKFQENDEYNRAKKELIAEFVNRFQKTPKELASMTLADREEVLESYVARRLDHSDKEYQKKFESDRFFFSRDRLCRIMGKPEKSILSLDIDEMFVSKAGNYIGEGVDQILNYETDSINRHNYCLWTIASNAVSIDTVKALCKERQKKHIDTYVLFKYTTSSVYASASSTRHPILKIDDAKKLTEKEISFLGFNKGPDGNYYVPEDIDCTAAGEKNAAAFVIQELCLINEIVNENKLKDYYSAVKKDGVYDIRKGGCQRSTFYVRAKKNIEDTQDMFLVPKYRDFCFVGKLAAPYIIKLNKE